MKRSKMLNRIASAIVNSMPRDCRHLNIEKLDNIANNVLNIIEASGMKPPTINYFPTEEEIKQGYNPVYFETNRWEPEDEAK